MKAGAKKLSGLVLWGANNIFRVQVPGEEFSRECRIKGKILDTIRNEHNALVAGDLVLLEAPPVEPRYGNSTAQGLICERLDRRNVVQRLNYKHKRAQAIAANSDGVVIISSIKEPLLALYFIDKLNAIANLSGLATSIIFNKYDLLNEADQDYAAQLQSKYEKLGLRTMLFSARSQEQSPCSLINLHNFCMNKQLVFVGASGVGKSSIINMLLPESDQATGAVSKKWQTGTHTTSLALLLEGRNMRIIDTPGIKSLLPCIASKELQFYFQDFEEARRNCHFQPCLHLNETRCAVKEGVESGSIEQSRYNSYSKLYKDLLRLEAKPRYDKTK